VRFGWRHRVKRAAELADEADQSLAKAKLAHRQQKVKLDREKYTVIDPLARLAEDNHLGSLVWGVIARGERGE
jgi:hypothetical protein